MSAAVSPRTAESSVSAIGCTTLIFVAVFAFIGFTLGASIVPLNQRLATAVACPNAVDIVTDVTQTANTIDTVITCTAADGTVTRLENDQISLVGYLGGAAVGALIGVLVAAGLAVRTMLRRGSTPT